MMPQRNLLQEPIQLVEDYDPTKVGLGSAETVARLGRKIIEMAFNPNKRANVPYRQKLEKLGVTQEAVLQLGNSTSLYTTAVAAMIEKALRPDLYGRDVIKTLPFDLTGHNSVEVPLGVNLTAQAIGDDGSVTADDQNYGGKTITIAWVGCQTSLTTQLLQTSLLPLIEDKLEEIGYAIARAVDSAIVAELVAAGTKDDATYGDNNNYVYCGASTTVSYDKLIDGITTAEDLDAKPDVIITNPTSKGNILKDSDVKSVLAYGTTPDGRIIPSVTQIDGKLLLSSSQVTDDKIILVDSKRCGWFVEGTPLQTWDGRLQTTVNFEVIGAKAYGVGISRPEAVCVIHENADAPI